jgi:hypothetical protein
LINLVCQIRYLTWKTSFVNIVFEHALWWIMDYVKILAKFSREISLLFFFYLNILQTSPGSFCSRISCFCGTCNYVLLHAISLCF